MKWTGSAGNAEEVYKGALGGQAPAAPSQPEPAPAQKEEKKVSAAPAKKPAAKQPSKIQKFKLWEISNYGDETLVFKKEEMMPGMTFNFFNCEKTKVVIEGKIKNAMLSRCKKVDITVEEVVSTVEIIKSEAIKARI